MMRSLFILSCITSALLALAGNLTADEKYFMTFGSQKDRSNRLIETPYRSIDHFGEELLANTLRQIEEVSHVSFINHQVSSEDIRYIATFPNLYSVELGQNPEGVEIDADTCDLISSIDALTEISICINDLTNRKLEFLGKCRALSRVNFEETLTDSLELDEENINILKNLNSLNYISIRSSSSQSKYVEKLLESTKLRGVSLDIGGYGTNPELGLGFLRHLNPQIVDHVACRVGNAAEEDFERLSSFQRLQFLEIGWLDLSAQSLATIAQLQNLKTLRIGVDATVLSPILELSTLPKLEWLQIRSRNKLGYEQLKHLKAFPRLRNLQLERISPTNEVIELLAKLELDWISVAFDFDSESVRKLQAKGFH